MSHNERMTQDGEGGFRPFLIEAKPAAATHADKSPYAN